MFQEVNKLCDLFLGLLHSCHIIEFHLYFGLSLYFIALFRRNGRNNGIGVYFSEDPNCEGNAHERQQHGDRSQNEVEYIFLISFKNDFCSIKFTVFMFLDHLQ